ncbi:MAG: branched-chain amino acid ABC transporter permease [Betaproteobacteria bacterium]|nr:branched-chain amino acid ABC transporter permease [Betaproteobacteria bacterium]
MQLVAFQVLNGFVFGMLLFLLSSGLSLIFGLMRVLNLAPGSFYMLGAFLGFALVNATGNFWLSFFLAPLLVALLGGVFEVVFLRPLYRRELSGHLDQMLLTVGFIFVFVDIVRSLWGGDVLGIPAPESLTGAVSLAGVFLPKYRLFIIVLGVAVAAGLWLLIEHTRLGSELRAGVDDADMAAGMGINVSRMFTCTFALGVGLAALAGVAAGPMLGVNIGMDLEILIVTLIVVVIGGMGSLKGALLASILIGEADTFGKAYFPEGTLFLIYVLMLAVLLVRPAGLFGLRQDG